METNKNLIVLTKALMIELYNEINQEFFDNSLTPPVFILTYGRTTLGSFSVSLGSKKQRIGMSKLYAMKRDTFKRVMIHEMIHQWQWVNYRELGHKETFKAKSKEIYEKSGGRYDIKRETKVEEETTFALFLEKNL